MSNAIARFRERQNLPMTVDVPWPMGNPEIIFKVARFAQMEAQAAMWRSEGIMTEVRGWKKPDGSDQAYKAAFESEQSAIFFSELATPIEAHVKGWVHTPGDGAPLPFTAANLKMLMEIMNLGERQMLGLAYTEALEAERQKKEPSTITETAFLKPSANGSSTSSTDAQPAPVA